MANYANLKATINANIKANGAEEITGPILNNVLNAAVNALGAGWQYMGVATPATSPGTPDANVFYIASTAGTYTNFGGLVVAEGEVAILKWNGSWAKEVTGAATAAQVTQLGQEVDEIYSDLVDPVEFELAWTDNRLLRSNGGIITISEGAAQYNRCAATQKVDCTAFQGKTIVFTHGIIAGDVTEFIFYNGNAAISTSYVEWHGTGVERVVVPDNATGFCMGVYVAQNGGNLSGSKAAASATFSEFLLVKKSDIADNLTTDDAEKVLSAKQGKLLSDDLEVVKTKVDELVPEETIVFPMTWVDNRLLKSNGGTQDFTEDQTGYYNRFATTDPIPCTDYTGIEMTVNYGVVRTFLAFYDSAARIIGTQYTQYDGTGSAMATIPSNAATFRLGISVNASGVNYTESKAAVSASVTVSVAKEEGIQQKLFSQKLFGAIDYAMPTDFDYSQLLFFGQSFAQGGSSTPVTTGVIPNCYMFGNQLKAVTGTAFNPLQLRTDVSEPYEFPVVSCANALSRMYRRYTHDINIVASTAGTSGASLQTLIASYISNVVLMHQNMKRVADGENKSVGCFAIVFMQGESDYGGRDNSTPDKDAYKALLLQTKNALQQSCMTNLGQERKPLFFIYQTSGGWVHNYTDIDNSALGVSMAQIEFAQENDDVVLISPCYQVTTYTDNHPSCNGYRWLGEMYAKAIWQTLYRGWRFSNPIPKEFVREDNRIIIYISSCILPLKFDTWTLPRQTNYGFKVVADGTEVGITSISLENNAIVLELGSSIASAASVKVTYGGVGVGRGNICDSDTWSTWLKYLSDANDTGYDGNRVIGQSPTADDGGSLVGKNYPMNNFLSIFYKEITQ